MVDIADEAFLEGKVEKKSDKKKKKRKEGDSKEADECSAVVPNTMEDGVKLRKEGKRKKDKKDLEVSGDADIGKKDVGAVMQNHQEEKSKRKKRKKSEHLGDSDKLNNEIQVAEEEQLRLQTDDVKDLRIDSEVKTIKYDKKKKRLEEDKPEEQPCLQTDDVNDLGNDKEVKAKKKDKKKRRLEEDKSGEKLQLQTDDVNDLGIDSEVKTKKKDKKKRLREDESHSLSSQKQTSQVEDMEKHGIVPEQQSSGEDNVAPRNRGTNQEARDLEGKRKTVAAKEVEEVADIDNVDAAEKVEKRKRKKENKKAKDLSSAGRQETLSNDLGNESETLAKDLGIEKTGTAKEVEEVADKDNVDASEKVEKRKRKKENKKAKDLSSAGRQETLSNDLGNESETLAKDLGIEKTGTAKEVEEVADKDNVNASEKVEKRKRKKENKKAKDLSSAGRQETLATDLGNESMDLGNEKHDVEKVKGKNPKPTATKSDDPKAKKKAKKVRFLSEVEVFPASESARKRTRNTPQARRGLVQGKRFTPEEDKIIKEAVMNYIQVHGLGEEGVDMVMHCSSHPKLKYCWKEIAAALPDRPRDSVYNRAHVLFQRDKSNKWSVEEYEFVKKFHAEHGPKWTELADLLGKHRVHVKDAWRRIKQAKGKKGNWSQEEYQNLFDLVNKDLRMKVYEEKKSKHGMLRDNIGWSAICDKMETRTDPICCMKWYDKLTSSMVKEEIWSDVDDYRMIHALYELDASCIEDVDWDNLLEHRPGDVCLRRWKQMYNHIGEHGCKSFADQVEVLSKRYCPELLEAREIWDNKPYVD